VTRPWTVRIAAAAQADFRDILTWTTERFSEKQARTYATTLSAAISALTGGPKIAGVRTRGDIAKGVHTLHVARNGHNGRHFIVFRTTGVPEGNVLEVLRILHDAMSLPQHVRT
jgi:toxin ParE1/3/4